MADFDVPKTQTLVEPSPVTHNNVAILCEPLIFTVPVASGRKHKDLLGCVEDVVERELSTGDFNKNDLKSSMVINGDVCEIRPDIKEHLRKYAEQRKMIIREVDEMDLNGNSCRELQSLMARLNLMETELGYIIDSFKGMDGVLNEPLDALRVHTNDVKHHVPLSLEDEYSYLALFRCQTCLLTLGVIMVHQPSRVGFESVELCRRVNSELALLKDENRVPDISEINSSSDQAIHACDRFIRSYSSYMWNVSFLYRMALKMEQLGADKDFLESKACMVRQCMADLVGMQASNNTRAMQKSITEAHETLKASLNCVLMMNHYKKFEYKLAYRAHKRTSMLLSRRVDSSWMDKFKKELDVGMGIQCLMPSNSWDQEIEKDDDNGEFGRARGAKPP